MSKFSNRTSLGIGKFKLLSLGLAAALIILVSYLLMSENGLGESQIFIGIALLLIVPMAITLFWIWRGQAESKRSALNQYQQLQIQNSIVQSLDLKMPLPAMGSWAISPDMGALLMEIIAREKPDHILEIGAGVSTLINTKMCERNGKGKVISVESESDYLTMYKDRIEAEDLLRFWEPQLCALSKDLKFEHGKNKWYDLDIDSLPSLDLILVDAPFPHEPLARYPALPLLKNKLKPGGLIILDDAARDDMQRIIELWKKEVPSWDFQMVDLEKGGCLIRKP